MKKLLALAATTILVFVLANKSNAQNNTPKSVPTGAIPATVSGYSMTAKINGKDCKASFIMPPEKAEQIVGFYNGDKYIGCLIIKNILLQAKNFLLLKKTQT